MSSIYRKYFTILCASFLLLVSGIILYNGEIDYSIIRFINHAFSLHLNEEFRSLGLEYFSTFLIYLGAVAFCYFLFRSKRISEQQFFLCAMLFLIIHYCFHINVNAVNYPMYDDQGGILNFLNQYVDAKTAYDKCKLIFTPYSESWMVWERFLTALILKIFHEVNFRYVILFNVPALFLLQAITLKNFLKDGGWKYFLALSILVFQFQYFDVVFYSIEGLSYYWVLIFAFASFYFLLKRESNTRFLAIPFATAAAFTFGNGFLVFPLCIIYLLINKYWFEVILWSIAFCILLLAFYFIALPEIEYDKHSAYSLLTWALFIPAMLGSAFQFFYTLHIPVLAGILILSVFVIAIARKWYLKSGVIFLMLAFLVLSVLVAARFRIDRGTPLQVRYGFFSIFATVFAIVLLIENIHAARRYFIPLLIISVTYNILSGFFFYPEAAVRTYQLQVIKNDARKKQYDLHYSTLGNTTFKTTMDRAIDNGIYKP